MNCLKRWCQCVVTAWCLAAGLELAAQKPPAETILRNGVIITVNQAAPSAQAVAIAAGRFIAVGSDAEVMALRAGHTRVVDLRGRTVVPGLSDNHLHNAGGGPGVDLSRTRSHAEVFARIAARALETPVGQLIVSNGDWHEAQLREQRLPVRRDLDQVAPNHPVVLVRGGHEYILNSAALRKWGIDERTAEPPGGRITRYADGSLNGELVDRARELVTLPTPPLRNLEERIGAQVELYRTLHAAGLTSVRHPGIVADDYRMLGEMQRRGVLTMRVNALLRPAANLDAAKVMSTLEETGLRQNEGNELLRVGGVKLAVDGGFEGGFMRTPYEEPWGEKGTFRGLQTVAPERYTAIVRALNRAGWRVFTHAVGDAAIDQVLDAYEAANRDTPITFKRWAVEHAFIGRPDHLPRMRALGLGVSAQNHLYVAGPSLLAYWGRDRASNVTPLRMYIDAGIPVSTGTDAGVIPYPPLWTLYHFVTRDTLTGGVFGENQRITREEALRASTLGNAWLTFEEGQKGSIEAGKLADLVVLSDNLLTAPVHRIRDTEVLLTMVGGEVVYARPGFVTEQRLGVSHLPPAHGSTIQIEENDVPYLRLTSPDLSVDHRRAVAARLTDTVIDLFYNPRGRVTREQLRERTTIHFIPYGSADLFIGGRTPQERGTIDLTVELSDWGMSVRKRRRVARQLTPVLAELFAVPAGAMNEINVRFHPYPPTDFAVGGKLLADLVPPIGRIMKRLAG